MVDSWNVKPPSEQVGPSFAPSRQCCTHSTWPFSGRAFKPNVAKSRPSSSLPPPVIRLLFSLCTEKFVRFGATGLGAFSHARATSVVATRPEIHFMTSCVRMRSVSLHCSVSPDLVPTTNRLEQGKTRVNPNSAPLRACNAHADGSCATVPTSGVASTPRDREYERPPERPTFAIHAGSPRLEIPGKTGRPVPGRRCHANATQHSVSMPPGRGGVQKIVRD